MSFRFSELNAPISPSISLSMPFTLSVPSLISSGPSEDIEENGTATNIMLPSLKSFALALIVYSLPPRVVPIFMPSLSMPRLSFIPGTPAKNTSWREPSLKSTPFGVETSLKFSSGRIMPHTNSIGHDIS